MLKEQNAFFQAVNTLIDKKIKRLNYNYYVDGIIQADNLDGTYNVKINGDIHYNICPKYPASYNIGDTVQILIKNGDYSKKIIDGYTSKAEIRRNNTVIDRKYIVETIYPVGSIYMSTNNANPYALFGFGVWTEWGQGKVPIGVDINDTDFNTPEKTGGSKELQSHNHSFDLTTTENGQHTHNFSENIWYGTNVGTVQNGSYYGMSCKGLTTTENGKHIHTVTGTINNTGEGNSENLQPYITCYMWKRVR